MQKKISKFIISMSVLCALLSLMMFNVFAAEGEGSITIEALVETGEKSTGPLPGADFTLFQVGVNDGTGWKLTETFEGSGVEFDFEDSSKQNACAQKLSEYAKHQNIQGTSGRTDQNGKLIFTGLAEGIYLIIQPEHAVLNKSTYQSIPFIVSVPAQMVTGSTWEVVVEPKFKNETIISPNPSPKPTITATPIPTRPVKTEDSANPTGWTLMIAGSLVVLLIGYCISRKKKDIS